MFVIAPGIIPSVGQSLFSLKKEISVSTFPLLQSSSKSVQQFRLKSVINTNSLSHNLYILSHTYS